MKNSLRARVRAWLLGSPPAIRSCTEREYTAFAQQHPRYRHVEVYGAAPFTRHVSLVRGWLRPQPCAGYVVQYGIACDWYVPAGWQL